MTLPLAVIGAWSLAIIYSWLAFCIIASYLSNRKGYGEKLGLATAMLLSPLAVLFWLVWPAREGSNWKVLGPFKRAHARGVLDDPSELPPTVTERAKGSGRGSDAGPADSAD
jgi:hypothetical protein